MEDIYYIMKTNLFNPMKLQTAILLFERGALALRVALQIKNVFIELRNQGKSNS
jgi:hypothetical protein